MFDFYKTMFFMGYLEKGDLKEATHWGVLSMDEYKLITSEDYDYVV